jgi:adenylate cyclase
LHNGMVDKFMGDGLMALFGIPLSRKSHVDDAHDAVQCAFSMFKALESFNVSQAEKGGPILRIGIGVHSGDVVAGNIGSPQRMEYTVIGDTVNVASRLESLTKEVGHGLILSQNTAVLLEGKVSLKRLETVQVRGRNSKIDVFTAT